MIKRVRQRYGINWSEVPETNHLVLYSKSFVQEVLLRLTCSLLSELPILVIELVKEIYLKISRLSD